MIKNKRFIPVYECVTQDNEVYVVRKGEHNADVVATALNEFYERNEYLEKENEQLKHELLCKQLDKAPTDSINCKCYYKELKE